MKNKNENVISVCFAGGGTGGHIYPGLAVCDSFKEYCKKNNLNVKIFWIGNSKGMDKTIVEKNVDSEGSRSADFFYGIPSGKLRRYFSFQNFLDIFKIFAGFIKSFFILLKIKPAVLFSKGGFVSVPPCIAAKLLKIPVFTHECDFTPGLATRINSKFATKILVSYDETKKYLNKSLEDKIIVTGNPVRPVFYKADKNKGYEFLGISNPSKPVLAVIGGSLGAKQINDLVKENIDFLCENFFVVHQTGQKNQKEANILSENPIVLENYKSYPFIYSQMPDVLNCADIVLSRSGANSIWECSVLSKPLILIPLCGSGTRGDQEDNAGFFEKAEAALVLSRENANSENLKEKLLLLKDSVLREKMGKNCKALSDKTNSAEKIASILYNQIMKIC